MSLTLGSLFSGVEGFGLGFEQAGFQIKWQVEQDAFCNAVLKTHWPAVQRFRDVRRVGKANLAEVDCITAGVPCQDVSIAGRRVGLKGKRTGLFYHFARILKELRPAWFVFENVPGLFSSNQGRDFAEVLRVLMVECGYGVSWRVLDSRYFNVAQRRERVFIVGRFGKPCPAEILFESESGAGDITASGEARSDIAVPLTSGSGESRPGRQMEDDFNLAYCAGISGSKRTRDWKGTNEDVEEPAFVAVAATLRESDGHHGRSSPRGDGCDNLVAFAENQRGELRTSKIAPQLSAGGGKPGSGYSAVAYTLRGNERNNSDGRSVNLAFALREDPGGTGQGHNCTYVIDEERSSKQQQQTEMDGTMQRNADDCEAPDSNGVRDFASLPKGMDSPRYRALGNAVTASVAYFIAKRIMAHA